MYTSSIKITEAANGDLVEGLQDIYMEVSKNLDEASRIQLVDVHLEATMEVLTTERMYVMDLDVEDELQQVIKGNNDESYVSYVMPTKPVLEERKKNHL